mgnify:CR=1 FL=1
MEEIHYGINQIGYNGPTLLFFINILMLKTQELFLFVYLFFFFINQLINKVLKMIIKQKRPYGNDNMKEKNDILSQHFLFQSDDEFNPGPAGMDFQMGFDKNKTTRKFAYLMANKISGKVYIPKGIPREVSYTSINDIYNGISKVGHKEIADMADFFDNEFVKKYYPRHVTKIATSYEGLRPEHIMKMSYRPECVVNFEIE